ncbi:MAG: sigma-70 family RNA polymerase sigma factor [Lentisphaerae bacterium]|jgi:RNA polymerase sigma-70 factor, ECF subfamily|nr:sigma-70 family RNA polymerase sigma factor [Lentisphaerota bacterium]MBT4816713.1 sigma-70 family RNA polymerase sigma factor [Lentisphaerota bacterium]MBT5607846.1 sigma-70 family RNA polymerase sigma factor [Lentisphaerota bacterium]MBT7054828.1 sigma-70 family RNA polymerase sigma factor [Lentisphaerota bacterium]MBT7845568.1 sigma-70 family RNA polymerase sigma factor [Lentisphaerota bacterium]
MTDDDLMALMRSGDDDAFDVLFDRHYASVYGLACALLQDHDGARDVLQETFLSVLRNARRYHASGTFRPWLLRICRNRCLTLLETTRNRRRLLDTARTELSAPMYPSAARQVDTGDALRVVQAELHRLPERQREAIVLHAIEGLRYREVAEVLGVPLNTVKTLIRRARLTLAQAVRGGTSP